MRLLSRSFVNKLINDQFELDKELSKEKIYNLYNIKPYKREGKTWLYKLSDVLSIGITFEDNLEGFYPIPNFEDKFWISKESKIININNMTYVSTYIGSDLYEHVALRYYGKKYRKRVHSLMGKVFLGNPPVVNHIDGNKSRNVLSNLEKSTNSHNVKHAYDNNYYSTRGGKGTPVIVISKESKIEYEFPSLRKAENFTGITRHRIVRIIEKTNVNNTNWDFKFK